MMGRNLVSQSWALKFLQPNPNAAPPFLQLAGLRTAHSTCLIAFIHHCRLLARQPWSLPQHQCLCFFYKPFQVSTIQLVVNWKWKDRFHQQAIWSRSNTTFKDFVRQKKHIKNRPQTTKSLFFWSRTIGRTGCHQQDWKCPSHTIQGWDLSFFHTKTEDVAWLETRVFQKNTFFKK